MIDHVGLTVADYAASKEFYAAALAPLGYEVVMELEGACGLGVAAKPDFWLIGQTPPAAPVHVAFASENRAGVDAFHAAALAAGGRDNGAPGLRAHYHPSYYGAFAFDPDGNNVEAVCHRPE